jgi:asparagine synthase (glutamine-hydrolysing)
MCGINGIVNLDNDQVSEREIKQMMSLQKHRGPDDEGIFVENNTGLGFVRLSILDLTTAGHQPMESQNKRYVIVFNGEIFNYLELKKELESKNYIFKTNTDTEVLLACYQEWGEDCLHKLNGMWSIAIYDKENQSLFAARDRYGIKPFYYILNRDKFIFASELPPLLSQLNEKPTENKQVIFEYLAYNRTDQTEQTFFNEIKKLQHGHCLSIKDGNVVIKKWYHIEERVKSAKPFQSAAEFHELFSDAIELRLRSDVPVGVCLSGGLDSSAITAMLYKKYERKDLNTFSAVYKDGETGDEKEFIHEFKDDLQNMHYITPTADTLMQDLDSFIVTHAEPIPSTGPYAQFKVMELAQKHVVVTLDGQGADEMLSGYHYFFGFFFKDLTKRGRFFLLIREILAYLKNHKSTYGLKTFVYFLLPSKLKTKARVKQRGYLNKDYVTKHGKGGSIVDNLYASKSLQQALINHFNYKLEHLLKWEDRNSMHFSLEARVPFLDYRLVERMLNTTGEHVIKNGTTKAILREAMKGIVPEKIRIRSDKVGFDTPQDKWFRREDFQKMIGDIILSESFKSRGIFNVDEVKSLYKKHIRGDINIAKDIWKWINLELWYRKYID